NKRPGQERQQQPAVTHTDTSCNSTKRSSTKDTKAREVRPRRKQKGRASKLFPAVPIVLCTSQENLCTGRLGVLGSQMDFFLFPRTPLAEQIDRSPVRKEAPHVRPQRPPRAYRFPVRGSAAAERVRPAGARSVFGPSLSGARAERFAGRCASADTL